jgi:hypothetical protein
MVTENKELAIRWDTSFEGKYFETYYGFLQHNKETNKLALHKHTIPHFIPVDNLVEKYLNTDFQVTSYTLP